jgi:hypothetical protein
MKERVFEGRPAESLENETLRLTFAIRGSVGESADARKPPAAPAGQ